MMASDTFKVFVVTLASGVAAGFAVVAMLADGPPGQVETPAEALAPTASPVGTSAASAATTVTDSAVDTAAGESFHEERYLVRVGDTLWDIAARHYTDPAAGMRRIKKRNGLKRDSVLAGETLVLPVAGRRSVDESAQADKAGAMENAPPR